MSRLDGQGPGRPWAKGNRNATGNGAPVRVRLLIDVHQEFERSRACRATTVARTRGTLSGYRLSTTGVRGAGQLLPSLGRLPGRTHYRPSRRGRCRRGGRADLAVDSRLDPRHLVAVPGRVPGGADIYPTDTPADPGT